MSKSKLGFLVAAIATSSILGISSASAEPQSAEQVFQNMNRDALQKNNAQVTSVSQFSDVQPTEWAFTALQSLVERYGCIAGFPNGTFRGNRATSRYEFAAGLNACLDKINELISSGLADKVGKEDLATLQKLQEEFAAELAALKGRVTALEAKTETLEAQQFSTTTKLNASVIFAAAGSFGNETATEESRNITFAGRVRLNFNTSFTGKDLLRIRLQAGNIQNNTNSNLTRLGFDNSNRAQDNVFIIDDLWYRFPVNNQLNVIVGTNSTDVDNILDPINPNLASSENGALSRFARRDPLVFRGQEGAGAGIQFKLNEQFSFNLAYLANNASNPVTSGPSSDAGLFGGGYSISAQGIYRPVKPLTLSFVYQRGYDPVGLNLTNSTGTREASRPPLFEVGASSDRFGFQANYDLNPNISLNGRFSYATTRAVSGGATADLLSWLTSVTFKDLFIPGSQASLAFGQPPYITSASNATKAASGFQSPYHLEAFYRFQLSRNISVTPGLITIFNPISGTASNDPVFVGVLRTSFTF